MNQLVWSALALWGTIALANRAALAADSGEPNEEPAAFRDFCLAANKRLESFLNDNELEAAPAVFKMMVKAGERAHAVAVETGLDFAEMGERRFLDDQELFETRTKVRPLCERVQRMLLWELNQEFSSRYEEAASAGVTLDTVGCTATERLSRFMEACFWYDSRTANRLEWPSEADERARLLKAGRAGFEEFCLKARFDVENFVSESPNDNLDGKVKAVQIGQLIGRKTRAIAKRTARTASEIKISEVGDSWYIKQFSPELVNLCKVFKIEQPRLYERLSEALEEQKAALQAGGQSGESLADVTLENVGCAATDTLISLQDGCHWWLNGPIDQPIDSNPITTPKPRRSEPRKKGEESSGPGTWWMFWPSG